MKITTANPKKSQLPGPVRGVSRAHSAARPWGTKAFTLLEVMIAMGIFFLAVFAILEVVTTSLRNARRLQDKPVDASPIISMMWLTNNIQEGSGSGDFGDLYPGYTWRSNCVARDDFPTNGIYEVEFTVTGPPVAGGKPVETHMYVLQWNPKPPALSPGANP